MTYMTLLRLSIRCRMRSFGKSLCESSKASKKSKKNLRSYPLKIGFMHHPG